MSKDYELIYDGLYRWSREGKVAQELTGGFLSRREAQRALELYKLSKEPEKSLVKGDTTLEGLVTKSDLLKWAELNSIEVPPKYKQPTAIKKWLQGGYKEQ